MEVTTIARPIMMSHAIHRISAGMVKSGAALIFTPNTLTGRRLSGSTTATNRIGLPIICMTELTRSRCASA